MQRSLRYGSVTVFQKMAFTGRAFTRTIKALEKTLQHLLAIPLQGALKGHLFSSLNVRMSFHALLSFRHCYGWADELSQEGGNVRVCVRTTLATIMKYQASPFFSSTRHQASPSKLEANAPIACMYLCACV